MVEQVAKHLIGLLPHGDAPPVTQRVWTWLQDQTVLPLAEQLLVALNLLLSLARGYVTTGGSREHFLRCQACLLLLVVFGRDLQRLLPLPDLDDFCGLHIALLPELRVGGPNAALSRRVLHLLHLLLLRRLLQVLQRLWLDLESLQHVWILTNY